MLSPATILSTVTNVTIMANKIKKQEEQKKEKETECKDSACKL
ncbi:hypothetical protein [Clostridium algidicarnis]|nr:hypothetical protein [Clostridium algidicarnis]